MRTYTDSTSGTRSGIANSENGGRTIIILAAAAAIRSEGSVHSHVRRAKEAGATPAEIRHALLLLTSTVGFPTVAAALTWAGHVGK
jgi:alkylhydroperoxidase/carboxymuconolactone decarboxylase family protein YurZ